MRSKQNLVFSPLLFFRFNEGKFKYHSRPFPFQNFKYGHKWVSHRSPCLFNSAHAKPNDRPKLSKLANHRVYKQLVYQKEILKAMLTGSLLRLSPVLTRFARNFFRSAFSLPSWSFEVRLLRMQIKVRD